MFLLKFAFIFICNLVINLSTQKKKKEKKEESFTEKRRDLQMKGTHKHKEA